MIYRLSAIPLKILKNFFLEIVKITVKFIWKSTGPRMAKMILSKEDEVAEITLPNGKAYRIPTVIKSMWYSWTDRDLNNKTEHRTCT